MRTGFSRTWLLLQQILSSSASSIRPTVILAPPLIYPNNLAGIVNGHVSLSHIGDVALGGVYAPARAVLATSWPWSENRVGMDAWMEYLAAILGVSVPWNGIQDDPAWTCIRVVASYREALGNFGHKKRLYTIFLLTHMLHWIRTLLPSIASQSPNARSRQENPSSKTPKQHHDTLYRAGIETLFSVEGPK
ncbi:hypothetical protein BKA82DRAFT_4353152 [Pisolithus tinctorius]|nr:hypothetical protein BKA82DRAFT_4353152 [Pisolithus tinctorius]